MASRALWVLLFLIALAGPALGQGPNDPNEGSALTPGVSPGSYFFSWWGKAGRTYFIRQSDSLLTWSYVPVIESGSSAVITWGVSLNTKSLFLKLEATDIPTSDPYNTDFTGAGVTAWQLIQRNIDPLSTADTGGIGILDSWRQYYFGLLAVDPSAYVAWSGSQVTNLQAFQNGWNPVDFYNGQTPTLVAASGDGQTGPPGTFVGPLVVAVVDSSGAPIAGAPVTFTPSNCALQPYGGMQLSGSALTLFANNAGRILVWCQLPNVQNSACTVAASPASGTFLSTVTFNESTDGSSPNPSPGPNPNPGSSDEPPVITYPAIPIGSADASPAQGIAIDDSNNVAYYSVTDGGTTSVHQWVSGSDSQLYSVTPPANANPYQAMTLSPGSISAAGQLAGAATYQDSNGNNLGAGFTTDASGAITLGDYPGLSLNSDETHPMRTGVCSINSEGDTWGMGVLYGSCGGADAGSGGGDGGNTDQPEGGAFIGQNTIPLQTDDSSGGGNSGSSYIIPFTPVAVGNANYYAFGTGTDGSIYYFDGGDYSTPLPGNPVAINNQGFVLGSNDSASGAYLWKDGSPVDLGTLMPKDYQGLLAGINPLLMSNTDQVGSCKILFDATDNTTGNTNTYVLTLASSGSNTLVQAQLPDGASSSDLRCINSQGVLAAIGSSPPTNASGDTPQAVIRGDSPAGAIPSGAPALLPPVDITVISFTPTSDAAGAGITEPWTSPSTGKQGVYINPGTIHADATVVHISVGAKSLPQSLRDHIASNYKCGLIQNVTSVGRTANYPTTQQVQVMRHGTPCLDMAPNAISGVPWAFSAVRFSADDQDRLLSDFLDSPAGSVYTTTLGRTRRIP